MKNEILERWRDVAARKGATAAILTPDGRTVRTFSEIDEEADRLAGQLAGLREGEVAGLQAPNVPAWPAALLAIWRSGGVALLLDHALGEGTRAKAESACGAGWRLELVEGEIRGVRLRNAAADFGAHRPDLIKLTSGTSGAPRAILFSAAQLLADGEAVCEAMGIAEGDVNYGVVTFSHSYGFSNLITPLLARGVSLVAAQDALPRAIAGGIAAAKATVLPAVPAIFQALSGISETTPTLRLCISAGAPLRVETADAFRARFGVKVHSFYGASECGGIAYDASDESVVVPGFVGAAMPGMEIESADDGGISVRSAAVGMGYFPEAGGEFMGGVFRPADLLERTPTGWRITGCRSDVINVGGKKASPSEIEGVLVSHPSVREAAVFGVGSAARTEAVCACVVAESSADMATLRAYCMERLSPWQVPRAIVRVDEIPVNARGKVSRAELAAQFADLL